MDRVRWGMIGCGDVTEVKSGPALQKADGSALVAVMGRNPAKAEDYARRHGVPKWTSDADALIHDPDVDAIYIATPPDSHCEYTLRAADAGKPVYVEKPMARTYAECQAMLDACRAASVPLFVAYYRRTLPRFVKIKELIDSGAIGEVRAVSMRLFMDAPPGPGALPWRWRPEIAGGGLFVDLGSHMIDYLLYALGPIASVRGDAGNQTGWSPAEDIVSASFTFASGAHATGLWWFSSPERLDRTEIYGTEGTIAFSFFGVHPVTLRRGAETQTFEIDDPPHVQQPLIQTIVDTLRGYGSCPSTGDTAAETSRIIDAILDGYRKQSAVSG
jgi:1,5-anhydro-D-fructose reductase (1,5-anhydro-D-mannitol-forming)